MEKFQKIKIYTKSQCPFCIQLIQFLNAEGLSFENISVDWDLELYQNLKRETNHHTVPQVFVDGEFIGGSEDFLRLYSTNERASV